MNIFVADEVMRSVTEESFFLSDVAVVVAVIGALLLAVLIVALLFSLPADRKGSVRSGGVAGGSGRRSGDYGYAGVYVYPDSGGSGGGYSGGDCGGGSDGGGCGGGGGE